MKTLLSILVLSLFISTSFGQSITSSGTQVSFQLNTITTAVPFLRIAPDPRSAGMGDIGLTTSPDAYALHWNTSKLAFSKRKMEIGFNYSPWMRSLVKGIHHYHLSGYGKIGNRHAIGGSVTYFDLGNIVFTDDQGNLIREFSPNEFEFLGGYAFQLGKRHALGVNVKYIYSNLTGGINAGTIATKAGQSVAGDLSYTYLNENINWWGRVFEWSVGANISNMGNKMAYTVEANRDFIPTNLGIGSALKMNFNSCQSLTASVDFNKYLVPTLPVRNGTGQIVSGMDNNVGVLVGAIQSFYDAPGIVVSTPSGGVAIEKGSRFKEELNEITIGGGLEYNIENHGAIRAGYFYEHRAKGDRKYLTCGITGRWRWLELHVSYLAAVRKSSPMVNTVRASLQFKLG